MRRLSELQAAAARAASPRRWRCGPVGPAVNDARYDGPECLFDPPPPAQESLFASVIAQRVRGDNPAVNLSPLLAAYDQVILDLDGTVWVGGAATPRAPEAVAAIRASGRRLVFVTNDGSHSPEEYVQKLWSIGCTAAVEEVVSVGSAIQYVLAERAAGAQGLRDRWPAGISPRQPTPVTTSSTTPRDAESADVVVAVAHRDFNYTEMLDRHARASLPAPS